MAHLPTQSCSRYCRHGPLRRPDDRLQPPPCIRNRSDTAQRPCLDQRHKGSDGRMGCTPNYRGISLGRSSKISPSRPGSNLWGSRHTSITYHGHSGQTHRTGFTLANCFAERLIGSMRRECLDHIVVFGEAHLRRILRSYARYYNDIRTHRSLAKDAPTVRPVQRTGILSSRAILGGLHHHYVRV